MPIFSAIPNFPHSCLSALHVSVITPLLALAFFTYFTILGGLQAVPLYQSYQIRDPTGFNGPPPLLSRLPVVPFASLTDLPGPTVVTVCLVNSTIFSDFTFFAPTGFAVFTFLAFFANCAALFITGRAVVPGGIHSGSGMHSGLRYPVMDRDNELRHLLVGPTALGVSRILCTIGADGSGVVSGAVGIHICMIGPGRYSTPLYYTGRWGNRALPPNPAY